MPRGFRVFATATPAPATTKAEVVDMLNVFSLSPPVPQVSTSGARSVLTLTDLSRITRTKPVISSTVSPFILSAVIRDAIWDGVASPSIIWVIEATASDSVRCSPSTTFLDGFSDHRLPPRYFTKVPEEQLSALGQDGFWVKLHTLDW